MFPYPSGSPDIILLTKNYDNTKRATAYKFRALFKYSSMGNACIWGFNRLGVGLEGDCPMEGREK